MSYITTKVRNGWLDEREDNRTDHRIQVTVGILDAAGAGIRSAVAVARQHDEDCPCHPDRLSRVMFGYRERVCCACGASACRPELPEWLTNECINQAWSLACSMIEDRAAMHHRQIARERTAARR